MGSSSTLPQGWSTLPPGWSTSAPQGDAPSAPPKPSMLQKATGAIGDVATGAGKGLLHTISGSDDWMRAHGPAFMTNSNMGFGPPANLEHVKQMATPQGTAQKIGYGGEQVGEFLAPGGLEERGAAKLATLAPKLGKYAAPLAHVLTSAISSGGVNAAQGGSPVTGALMGAGGQVIGQGLKAAAPVIAETALGLPKAARAFGKTPGTALLNETRGIRPSTIAASAQERLGQLNPQLEQAADAASVRPAPRIAGFLPPPREEIPLAPAPTPRNPKMSPMGFPARVNPEEPFQLRREGGSIEDLPFSNPHYLSGSEHPELSGRVTPLQNPQQVTTRMGILLRQPEMSASIPPTIESNPVASLRPARSVISGAMGKAANQNAEGLHGQLGNMLDSLSQRFQTGEPIPENITPRQLLDLKRGFNEENLRWNPEMHDRALSTGRQAYNALDQELDRTVPESAGLNQRISSLIPVAQRAESISRGAPTLQRAAQRFGAHTGALTLGGIGGYQGYREGGVPGAIAGGLTGVLAPELIASPEGQMALARTLNKANGLRPLVGGALQLDRKKGEQ